MHAAQLLLLLHVNSSNINMILLLLQVAAGVCVWRPSGTATAWYSWRMYILLCAAAAAVAAGASWCMHAAQLLLLLLLLLYGLFFVAAAATTGDAAAAGGSWCMRVATLRSCPGWLSGQQQCRQLCRCCVT
jgi:hypothetical protein